MSIDKITSKILSDAEAYKKELLDDANAKSEEILGHARTQADAMIKESRAKGEEEKAKTVSRKKSVADIDSKKVILSGKQNMIVQCFEKALEQIISEDEESYVNLLVEAGIKSGQKSGLLIFNEKDKEKIGQKVTDRLNAKIENGNFKKAEETRSIRGGYILACGLTSYNNTVEAMVEECKEQCTAEVAEMLFGQKNEERK